VSRCVCNGLGVYIDGDDHSEQLHVFPCDGHPLPFGKDESADGAAGARVDACLDAIAAIREILWPHGDADAEWSSDTIDDVAPAVSFLRPPESDQPEGRGGDRPSTRTLVMTVTLDKIGRDSVEVELPLACPHCGSSFEEEDALLEEGYCATNQPCSIALADGERQIDGYAATESIYDIGLVVGYQCAGCRRTLVSTETVPTIVEPTTRGA
jgi:hypothetical protein